MTVLIVDDQDNMCWVLAKILSNAGFTVEIAKTAAEALSIVGRCDVSAAIIDFRLPDSNGFDLFTQLRKHYGDFPCILITSYGSSTLRAEALALGFSGYFDKPFDNKEITAAVREALDSRNSQ